MVVVADKVSEYFWRATNFLFTTTAARIGSVTGEEFLFKQGYVPVLVPGLFANGCQ